MLDFGRISLNNKCSIRRISEVFSRDWNAVFEGFMKGVATDLRRISVNRGFNSYCISEGFPQAVSAVRAGFLPDVHKSAQLI
jgi:hypothetical protein